MAKLTDALVTTLKSYFETGDQPTAAQFAALIDAIQGGIEDHDHAGVGDGDSGGIGGAEMDNEARYIFFPVTYAYNKTAAAPIHPAENMRGWPLADSADCVAYGHWRIPSGYDNGLVVYAVVVPAAAGNLYSLASCYLGDETGAEDWDTHGATYGWQTVAQTLDKLDQVGFADVDAWAAADDMVFYSFERDATHANDTVGGTVYVAGFVASFMGTPD